LISAQYEHFLSIVFEKSKLDTEVERIALMGPMMDFFFAITAYSSDEIVSFSQQI
jgi:hypothetical protein